ncbi:hypothetical protein ACFQ21_00135 [Ohtaekwangia kribbensis]|uniref:Lipoprotein n=1 Tax=Ohtaekwangia kribbensis TaxID=688913 RepID=A0ABW3JVK3_9BACT
MIRVTSFFAVLMVFLLVAVGCSRKTTSSVTETLDSTHVKEVPRLLPISVPGAAVIIKNKIECDPATNKPKPFTREKKSGHSTLKEKMDTDGNLTTECRCDSLELKVQVMDREIFRLRQKTVTKTVIVTEYKTRKIDIVCRWFSGIVLLIIVGRIALKYYTFSWIRK